jgi:hypothetical protein
VDRDLRLDGVFCFGLSAQSDAASGPPLITQVVAMAVSQSAATLKARIDPAEKVTSFSFEYGLEDCETSSCAKVAEGSVSVPTTEEVTLEGLSPGTLYHYRVTAENSKGKASSGDRVFATRSGIFSGLPDNRAYEQASPTDKDGGDLQGYIPLIKAAESGGGITFESTFGVHPSAASPSTPNTSTGPPRAKKRSGGPISNWKAKTTNSSSWKANRPASQCKAPTSTGRTTAICRPTPATTSTATARAKAS